MSVILFGLLATLAACGGDSAQQAKAEFIAAADELCRQAEAEIEQVDDPGSEADLPDALGAARSIYAGLKSDLDDLDDPDEGAGEARDIIDSLDDLLAALDDAIEAAGDRDGEALEEAFDAAEAVAADVDPRARAFGFEECGVDDDAGGEASIDDAYPVINQPSDEDVAALVPIFVQESDGAFTEEEAGCIARFLLERVTLSEWIAFGEEDPPRA